MKKYLTLKRILSVLAILLVVVQFIRPERNEGNAYGDNDITHFTTVPDDVKQILETSCYDCHSDHTNYPWYTNIQPIGLWMQHHVDEGKHHLNYSQYVTYKPKRQKHKMEETIEMIREGEMPMESYTFIHKNAELTPAQQQIIIHWAESVYNGITLPVE